MDLFTKCKNYDTVKKLKEADIYPYFHKLESKHSLSKDEYLYMIKNRTPQLQEELRQKAEAVRKSIY